MLHIVAVTALALAATQAGAMQGTSVLHIKVSAVDADGRPAPLARHALLISDNPASAPPKRVITMPDGTVDVRLRPGNYTVESDRPAAVQGHAYQWTQVIEVVAGRDTTLELTAANADVGSSVAVQPEALPTPLEEPTDVLLLAKWQNSVVGLWTEHRHAGGFVVSNKGLVATSLAGIGDATSLEVQFSATVKVAGRVLATDPARDVAIVEVDSSAATSALPVPLPCGSSAETGVTGTQDLWTIDVPLLGPKGATLGAALDVGPEIIDTSFVLRDSAAGGPVFAADGQAIGLTSMPQSDEVSGRGRVRVVRASAICGVVASAEQSIAAAARPGATHLPVESSKPLPLADMKAAAAARGFVQSAYASSSSEFDILFITPVLLASAEVQLGRTGVPSDTLSGLRAATDFGEWSEYVTESPPVLFIRATPRLVESFWMKFARGAASTQGAAIPPIKHVGPGFSRMRLLCGNREVAPVHPFRIRARISETEGVDEGFYAFDPMAIGPHCGTVSLVLSSVKDPGKTETRVIAPAVIAQVWKDFAAYRER